MIQFASSPRPITSDRLGRRELALRAGARAALDLERRRAAVAEQAAHQLAREALGALRRRRGRARRRRRDAHAIARRPRA